VVDDEAAGGAEAVRAEVAAVAVAGQDEQVGTLRRGDNLAFHAAGALAAGTGAAEPLGGGLEELGGGRGGEVLQAGAGVAPPAFGRAVPPGLAAASRPAKAPCAAPGMSAGVTWSRMMSASAGVWARAASTHADQVPSTIQTTTVMGSASSDRGQ
jgi:hypothetical protein